MELNGDEKKNDRHRNEELEGKAIFKKLRVTSEVAVGNQGNTYRMDQEKM